MSILTPKISPYTYHDIVIKLETLAEAFTKRTVSAVQTLKWRTLDEDIIDPATDEPVAVKGTIVREALAEKIARIEDLGRVRIKGWRHPGSVEVRPTRELLTGYILNEAIIDPESQELIASSGTVIDSALADRIQAVAGLSRVSIKAQPPGVLVVEPTFEAVFRRVLDEDVRDPVTQRIIATRGDLVDTSLAKQISRLEDLPLIGVRTAPDAGWALIRIFGRLAELVIERLNQVPDKNFLAFLDLIGTQIRPPQPARAPLTFHLATGSPADAFVPPQTQVAAPAVEDETTETIFETDRGLMVTTAQLKAVFGRDPDTDRFADHTQPATTVTQADFPVFVADRPIEHSLYLAHDDFFTGSGPKNLTLDITTPDAAALAALPISWSYWNGQAWRLLSPDPRILEGLTVNVVGTEVGISQGVAIDDAGRQIALTANQSLSLAERQGGPLLVMISWNEILAGPVLQLVPEEEVDDFPAAAYIQLARLAVDDAGAYKLAFTAPSPPQNSGGWQITVDQLPAPTPKMINGLEAGWLRAHLDVPWPKGLEEEIDAGPGRRQVTRQNLLPDMIIVNQTVQEEQPFYPFGSSDLPQRFYLSLAEAFIRPGAEVAFDISLGEAGAASSNLMLTWSYWNGQKNDWDQLGQSDSNNPSLASPEFEDGTQAFTQNGTVSFKTPEEWSQRQLFRQFGYWLRVQVQPGDDGSGENAQPPQVASLLISYRWAIPQIEKIAVGLTTHQTNLLPEMGLTNTAVFDLTSNFYPFGERPRLGDIFYLNSHLAFAKPGAKVELEVTLSNPPGSTPDPPLKPVGASDNLQITWEVWDGQGWFKLGISSKDDPALSDSMSGFADETQAFTLDGKVNFTLPGRLGTGAVSGETGYWVRARISQGNYGREAYYEEITASPGFKLNPASFKPPLVKSLTIHVTYQPPAEPPTACLTYNDFLYADYTAAAREAGLFFEPFVATADTRPALYLGFDRPFANRPMTLYAKVKPALYDEAILNAGRNNVDPAQVSWEYAGPAGWTSLGVDDETQAFAERGLISFVGPKDISARLAFGQQRYWLRARWDSGHFVATPRLHYLLTNTTWASQATTLQNEILGSSNGEPNQVFHLTRAPVLVAQQIEVREPALPSEAERTALEAEEGAEAITIAPGAAGRPAEIWVRWHQAPDFHGSGPRDRHYVLDPLTGTLYFGNGQYGLAPPQGRNNVRARRYRTGGGAQGNRPSETIIQLKSTTPYVDGVVNYEAAAGGADQESLEQVKERGPRLLRHRGRAVAAQDFADLAREASPDVARARAITPNYDPFDQKWIDPQTEENAGQVGLIIVPRSAEVQPIPSLELINRVERYILARCAPTLDMWVAGPDWVQVWVEAEVAPASLEAANTLETTIVAALQRFIHPLTGGPDGEGWVFGREPYESDLYHLLESLEGVDHIRSLTLHKPGIGVARPNRFLIYSGVHQIKLVS